MREEIPASTIEQTKSIEVDARAAITHDERRRIEGGVRSALGTIEVLFPHSAPYVAELRKAILALSRTVESSPGTRASHWDEDPNHPVQDWRAEVANDDTRLGYLEWVEHQREMNSTLETPLPSA